MIDPLPPLAAYLHLPWCERKCPYCDFNSHAAGAGLPEADYVTALLADMRESAASAAGRRIETVFIGGGTPSLFSPAAIAELLDGLARHFRLADDLEVTMEANPGSAEQSRFAGYRAAGVNRLSLGIQSFDDACLRALGRVHDAHEAARAVDAARGVFERLNLDLMHGLPGQSETLAVADLEAALAYDPGHLSWYQLTVEPNTVFAKRPPTLPVEDELAAIQDRGQALLADAGYAQYEVSAFARPGQACRHNLNYWTFGDYLGFGAGAHGKLSTADGIITRYRKTRLPADYMNPAQAFTAGQHALDDDEKPLEFMMNALRLVDGVPADSFQTRTGLSVDAIAGRLAALRERGLLRRDPARIATTELGLRYLNDVLAAFD